MGEQSGGMDMKRMVSVLCIVVVLISFVACTNKTNQPSPVVAGQASEAATETVATPSPTIACIYAELTSEFWGIAANGANTALKELKASGKISGDSYLAAPSLARDVEQQKVLIDEAIAKKVDGIVLSAANADEIGIHLSNTMVNLADGGIPIIAIDCSITVPDTFDCVVSTNKMDIALMSMECGKIAAESVDKNGDYVYIEIDTSSSGLWDRFRGAVEWLEKNASDMHRLDIADDGIFWASPAGGIDSIQPFIEEELLEKIAKDTNLVILAATEPYTIEACKAIKESGIQRTGKTMVIGFGFSQQMYDHIKIGEVYGTVGQNPYLMGYESVYMMAEYLVDNKRLEEFTYVPFTVVTQNNLETEEVKEYLQVMEISI